MEHAVFEIKKNSVGRYFFTLRDCEGFALLTSASFSSRAQLEMHIASVRDTAPFAMLSEVLTALPIPPLFLIQERSGGYAFSLIGYDGEILFTGERYRELKNCLETAGKIKVLSLEAGILDSVQ